MFNPESLKDGVAGEWILVKFHLGDFQTVFTTVLTLRSPSLLLGEWWWIFLKLTNLSVWQMMFWVPSNRATPVASDSFLTP